MDQFQGINSAILCSLAGRYDNPIPTRFLYVVPIDCSKIPAQARVVFSQPLSILSYDYQYFIIA
jgi:hypothetical protein